MAESESANFAAGGNEMFRSTINSGFRLVLAVTAALAFGIPSAAIAAPVVNGEFPVSDTPRGLTQGPDGNMWAAVGGKVAKVTPAGVVTEFDPTDIGFPYGITTGPDGNLWVTQSGGVARFSAADPNGAVKFAIADITDPRALTTGPDGNLWTASGDKVVKIPPAAPTTATAFTIAGLGARDIAKGGDGNLWVADFAGARILRVTTAGVSTPFAVGGGPQGVAAGPGSQIAFANPGAAPQHVGRINLGGSPLTTKAPNTDPFGIRLGPDGAYWIAEFATGTLGRLTTDGKLTTLKGFSAGSGPRYVAPGPGNTVWVSLEQGKKIARVTGVVRDLAPSLTRLSLSPAAFRTRSTLRYTLSERASVRLTVERRLAGGRFVRVRTLVRTSPRGRTTVRFNRRVAGRRLAAGRYRLTAIATDPSKNAGRPRRVSFRVVGA